MYNHIAVVHENPPRRRIPFDVQRPDSVLFRPLEYLVHDGLDLTLAISAADDKVISQQGNGAYVQQDNIRSLFVGDGIDDLPG